MALTITRRGLESVGTLANQTVSDTALFLDFPLLAGKALISVEDQGIRWRDDGVAPTPTVGNRIDAGADPFFYEGNLRAFKMIRASGIDSKVQTLFYTGPLIPTAWDVSASTVGHYKLNDRLPNTTILDSSGNAFNGALEGGAVTENVSVAGLVSTGRAFDLNGVNGCGNISNVFNGSLGTTKTGTLLCVAEPDFIATGNATFIAFGDAAANTFIALRQDGTDGKVSGACRSAGSNKWIFSSNDVVITNGWPLGPASAFVPWRDPTPGRLT